MPFSRLITSAYATTTTVVRSCSSSGGLCSHGLTTGRASISGGSTRATGLRRNFGSHAHAHSAFSHLASRYNTLFAKPTPTTPLSSLQPAKARTLCSNADEPREFSPEIERLSFGNHEYVLKMREDYPGFLAELANEVQKPSLMILDCADSRVDEQAMFNIPLGTAFTTSNIANQFNESDLNTNAVLSFAVESLKVPHIIVLGHYGCGGVANSMMPPPANATSASVAVQRWIQPIREIYETSSRPEIVAHREKCKASPMAELPDIHEPAFRALVEENVKFSVQKVANSTVIREIYASPDVDESAPTMKPFIHGLIYDMESGEVLDLDVTVAPPGRALPFNSFNLVGQKRWGE